MRIGADVQGPADVIGGTVQTDRLGDRQDMPLIKRGVQRLGVVVRLK